MSWFNIKPITTVYAVSSGEYSDYGINCIFSTRPKAEEYIRLVKEYSSQDDFNEIEEYVLDPSPQIPHKHKFKYFYHGSMDRDGNLLYPVSKTYIDIMSLNDKQEFFTFRINEPSSIYGKGYSPNTDKVVLSFTVNANDPEHAQKIMGEKRSKIIRENKWPTFEEVNTKTYDQLVVDI